MTSTKRLYLAPDAPPVYESDHYLVMDRVGSESAVKILASDFLHELVAARSPYVSLDARLDALVMSGGNVATKANGVSAAGQNVLTVDATTGFVVGAPVVYLLNNTTLEGNTIASVQDGVSLTMTTNIGTGGVLDDSYISMISISEYLSAQAIPHVGTLMLPQTIEYMNAGAVRVKACGAKGDGSTDDQAALEVAWGKLSDGGTLIMDDGTYAIADTVNWKDKSNITIIANQAIINPKTGSAFAGKAVVDMAGCLSANVTGLRIDSTLTSSQPAAALVLGRVDAGDGGGNRFDNCDFDGKYTACVVYDCGSELSSFWHCRIVTRVAGKPCYLSTSRDDVDLVAQNAVSNVSKRFYDCTLLDYSGTATGQVLVEIRGVTKEISLRDCYFVMTGAGKVINLVNATTTGDNSMYGLSLDNIRVEGVDHADSRLLYCGQDGACASAYLHQINWSIASDYVIEVPATGSLQSSVLFLMTALTGSTKWMHVSNSILYNYIVLAGSASISIDSGDVAQANYIVGFGTSVFTGAGVSDAWPRQDNIVATIYDQTPGGVPVTSLSTPRIGVSGRYLDGHSATPSVAGSSQIDLQQDAAATITSFTDMVGGQELTLLARNSNTTIAHGAAFKLKGGVNWNMPNGATLTLKYFAKYSTWYETGRMDPS